MVYVVKPLGMETCVTLGMLAGHQAQWLKDARPYYDNHNLDTAPEFYQSFISTRVFQDRLDDLGRVRGAGFKVCSGGIVGMGETRLQRAGLIAQLANIWPYSESVPINHLVQVPSRPLYGQDSLDALEFVRTIAVAAITMPTARMRLSAGRRQLSYALASHVFHGWRQFHILRRQVAHDRQSGG